MFYLGIGKDEHSLSADERRWRRELRSASLRLAVFAILFVNLLLSEHGGNFLVHANVVVGYGLATTVALTLALARKSRTWFTALFTTVDAVAVVALFHEHLFVPGNALVGHALTTTNLAIAFVLLVHAALRLRPALVALYASVVVIGWLSLLLIKSAVTHWQDIAAVEVLQADSALAASFAFAAFLAFLLIRDHDSLLRSALRSERRRLSLSRFFSPDVVAELERRHLALDLERREAAVMFVDLRAFTRFVETASPTELAELLVEYRTLVTQAVFADGGTVDKFIGDGVMAVFGQPRANTDDADRAIHCALHLGRLLARWRSRRLKEGRPALAAGIGLHLGPVIGGVLESGLHDEFTVLGDAVNVAERLERVSKSLDAVLVVSAETLRKVRTSVHGISWVWKEDVELEGRSGSIDIAYLPRQSFDRDVCDGKTRDE